MFWKSSTTVRTFLSIALVLYVLADVFTFSYFYPRNDILFKTVPLTMTNILRKAWSDWNSMNWLRSFMVFAGLIFSFLSLNKIYGKRNEEPAINVTGKLSGRALQTIKEQNQ
jgi:hypothetical protein